MHKDTRSSPSLITVIIAGVILSSMGIHFWLTDWFSCWLELSHGAAEAALFMFQGLFAAWCALKIAMRRDGESNGSGQRIKK